MRLNLILLKVEPTQYEFPKKCPQKGCSGMRFIPRQEVSKKLVDVVDYCIPGSNLLYPVWYPDSQSIAVLSFLAWDEQPASTVILDLHAEQAFRVADGMIPIDWMIEP